MITLAFIIGLAALLFALAFVTKRRFGVLGLGLAAGALLSAHWVSALTAWLEKQGFHLATPPLACIVAAGLILSPSLILLFSGPSYSKMWPRIFGALGFALLALAFLLDPLGAALNLQGPSLAVYQALSDNRSLIIVAGLLGAIVDALLTRPRAKEKDGKKRGAH